MKFFPVDRSLDLLYYVHMNKNIYNYKHVTEFILPVIDRVQFADDFYVALHQKPSYVKKFLGDKLNQVITDVVYYKNTDKLYRNIPHLKYQRLWNAFCLTYWPNWTLNQSEIDQWGYIKWRDIGYQPNIITSYEDAYAASERNANSEPDYSYEQQI